VGDEKWCQGGGGCTMRTKPNEATASVTQGTLHHGRQLFGVLWRIGIAYRWRPRRRPSEYLKGKGVKIRLTEKYQGAHMS